MRTVCTPEHAAWYDYLAKVMPFACPAYMKNVAQEGHWPQAFPMDIGSIALAAEMSYPVSMLQDAQWFINATQVHRTGRPPATSEASGR